MIKTIHLENYRSFADAKVDLAPFNLVIGANGAGKTNFLRAFEDCGALLVPFLQKATPGNLSERGLRRHFNGEGTPVRITFHGDKGDLVCQKLPASVGVLVRYRLQPDTISRAEPTISHPMVSHDGGGTTQCLESLKNGDQEALFDQAEAALKKYVPEIEKLSFANVEPGKKQMQVRERGIRQPVPASELSDGTRIIIALLAIIHQPSKPPVICIEEIDHGMHPRIFEQMVSLMERIAIDQSVQIIGTTHNPYLVDCFRDKPESVIIVEKKDGTSTLGTLAQRLDQLDCKETELADMPLGTLWFSGFVGGVPEFLRPKRK